MNLHVMNICKIGQGHACCRYLLADPQGFMCAKFNDKPTISLADVIIGKTQQKSVKDLLDERVVNKTITARGDNCEGKDREFLNSK